MATGILTEKDVRLFLMDKPELNPLLRGVRWTPEEIEAAMFYAVSFFNESMPATVAYTIESFPFKFALLSGTVGHLLRSAAINEASNNITYSLDGVQVNDKDKAAIFTQMGNQYWDEFKLAVKEIKISQNVSAAFGSRGSEFMRIAY